MITKVAIWNPNSGSAPAEEELRAVLGDSTDLVETTPEDPGSRQTADAVERGADVVIACGGDGTVRACLDSLAGTDTSLAVVPLGTGNLLATNLGISSGLDGAVGIGEGPVEHIDLGRINGEAFSVMAGSGFDALMIRDANEELKSRLGTIAYVFSALKNLRADLVGTQVSIDGQPWFTGRSSMVLVGNFGTISGGIEVFPDAVADDGVLDVAVMSANTLREWASVAWRLIRGKPQRVELARRAQGRHIIVDHARPRAYELDGEDRDPARRLEIGIEPGAIAIHHKGSDR